MVPPRGIVRQDGCQVRNVTANSVSSKQLGLILQFEAGRRLAAFALSVVSRHFMAVQDVTGGSVRSCRGST